MKPAPFDYVAPTSLDEAVEALASQPDEARVLAGGQSLVALMNLRLATPATVVDINRIAGLDRISEDDDGVRIGASARQAAVERSTVVASKCPLVVEALHHVSHPQLRTRGTVVGSLAHHDPAAELPAVAVALDAVLELRSAATTRRVPAADFFTGYYTTALMPGELVTSVWFPVLPTGTVTAFGDLARRRGDFALLGVAVAVHVSDDVIEWARIAMCAMSDRPVRCHAVEAALTGARANAATAQTAAAAVHDDDLDPVDDVHATAAYRRRTAPVLVERTLRSLLQGQPIGA